MKCALNDMYYILYVGIDDTDSRKGMCTTYISAVIMDELKSYGFQISGYPRLIRLNPFARFKTRGNGAVSFKLIIKSDEEFRKVKELILNHVEKLSHLDEENTNPGVVFYKVQIDNPESGIDVPPRLISYAQNTVKNMVSIADAESLAQEIGAETYKFKKGRGIIGALAAIGCPLEDKTFELLAYRIPENYGMKRKLDYQSIQEMNQRTYPNTFDNLDEEEGYIAIEPHTPCPILYGIRGENPEAVIEAHNMVISSEMVERTAVYVTNQHTDQHLIPIHQISKMEKYKCYIVKGMVVDKPHTIEGGHVFLSIKDDSGSMECAAYEPTKGFRDVFKQLRKGDLIKVYGGIGEKDTLNVEKFELIELANDYKTVNPLCECGKRMKSAGKNKGFKCPSCGQKLRDGEKTFIEVERSIKKGYYEVPPTARRHLSKPLIRCKNLSKIKSEYDTKIM